MEADPRSQSDQPALPPRLLFHAAGIGLALLAGLALRIWFYRDLFEVNGDTLVYGAIAKNLALHARYGLTWPDGSIHPTLIRLPGYPLFLAACFRLFGMENYAAATWLQIALGIATCLLVADTARRLVGISLQPLAFQAALWLAALCPFTAVYDATPLTEGPTLFATALAVWSALRLIHRPYWRFALAFTFGILWTALLRPDGVLLGVALVPAVVLQARGQFSLRLLRIAFTCAALAVIPFAIWTIRNARVFAVFQPLVPASATDPGNPVYPGFERWVKTWSLDFTTTYTVYWNIPGDVLNPDLLPARAFDFAAQRAQTDQLAAAYNNAGFNLSPALDAGFAHLAAQRIAAHPLRYYLWLPAGRAADMWLRPRVDNLNIDLDWWVYSHHHSETRFSWFYAALNALYLVLGLVGLCMRPRYWLAILIFFLMRSLLLATIAAPETRYTLECFPMLFVLGGIALSRARIELLKRTTNYRTT